MTPWLAFLVLWCLAGVLPVLANDQADLLILCPAEFRDACKPLKEHKDATGMPAILMDWRIAARNFSQGRDEAEQLKLGIDYFRTYYGIKYVLLMGDCSKLPVRYLVTDRPQNDESGNRIADWAFYPVDMYYAALYKENGDFDDWNAVKDDLVGELHGERLTGKVNYDQISYLPDVVVGRVPASTVAEVTTYVNKVIYYETFGANAYWGNGVLLATSSDPNPSACNTLAGLASWYLLGMDHTQLYSPGNSCPAADSPNATNINVAWNGGLGLAAYMGHGNYQGWCTPTAQQVYRLSDLAQVTNHDGLPVVFAAACDTGRYAPLPPYSDYTDVEGVEQIGTINGASFSTTVPPLPACLQETNNLPCFAEDILLKASHGGEPTGAVAYIGCVTGAQVYGDYLLDYFFQSVTGQKILGEAWRLAIESFYRNHPDPGSLSSPDWHKLATFHTPLKFHLFGDPSLRLGGIYTFERSDFAGNYAMVHDTWQGRVGINSSPFKYSYPNFNLQGTYVSQLDGQTYEMRGRVISRFCHQPQLSEPHAVEFYVDFNHTDTTSDDQYFLGYLFTWTKKAIAGICWWNNAPYGFYLIKDGASSHGSSRPDFQTREFSRADFIGTYNMNHDGWPGSLQLWDQGGNIIEGVPPLGGLYIGSDGKQHSVRGYIRDGEYPQPDSWGPRYQIRFYIDFNDTMDTSDDQEFVGYLCGPDRRNLAGLCYWHGRPFGFYALR